MFGLLMPKGIFSYAVMPEISIRFQRLFMGGFHYIPFFIATVYQMVGILPRSHPYLLQSNLGLYGIRHVVFEAGRNIKFSLKNIDQIILFIAVLAGLVIFLVQILSLGAFVFFQPAMAAFIPTLTTVPTDWGGFFTIDVFYRSNDLAYMMLDMVFGVPYPNPLISMGFFESCVGSMIPCLENSGMPIQSIDLSSTSVTAGADQFGPLAMGAYSHFPFPYHLGMHRLFAVYSNGLLVIAVIITSYFIVTILAETAQTGTPFGKRFNKTWAPLRIVIAFGLLMPLSAGLNSSQYIVLYAAKYGSAFATNGWQLFNNTLTDTYLGEAENLVTVPNTPSLSYLTQFMYVARVCKVVNDIYELKKYREETGNSIAALPLERTVHMYALWKKHSDPANVWKVPLSAIYDQLLAGLDDEFNSVSFVFGIENDANTKDRNTISPVCGEINLTLTDPRNRVGVPPPLGTGSAAPGPFMMQETYFNIIMSLWYTGSGVLLAIPALYQATIPEVVGLNNRHIEAANRHLSREVDVLNAIALTSEYVNKVNGAVEWHVGYRIKDAALEQGDTARLKDNVGEDLPMLIARGWAAAGLWYNRVAEMNGSLVSSVFAVPVIVKYPAVQERVSAIKAKYNKATNGKDDRKPEVVGPGSMANLLGGSHGLEYATALHKAEFEWSSSGFTKEKLTSNAFLDAISSLLGLNGLYDMRKNPNAHPLAMLVGIGRSLVESAIKSLGYAAMSAMLSAAGAGSLSTIAAGFFVSISMMGLTVGFVLFYVVPFLPFIYFFFAVGGWIKGIFEAMVGAPLWALAHIRIDGHGMPGNAAINGYFLIFEVFLRPILIVFGLLASISIFSALVSVLNNIFTVVTSNVGGFDMSAELDPSIVVKAMEFSKSRIDEFFFTIVYAIIVYMIGMSSFKLIDNIPNNILRWMGQSVATFGDQRENPAEGLVSKTTIGSQQSLGKIGSGLQSVVGGADKIGS